MSGLREHREHDGLIIPESLHLTKIVSAQLREKFAPLAAAGSLIKLKKHPLLKQDLGTVQQALAESFLNVIRNDDHGFNPSFFVMTQFFRGNGSFLYFTGLPVEDNLPPTPKSIRSKTPATIAEFISLAVLAASGHKINDLMIGNVVLRNDDPEIEALERVSYEPYHTHAKDADYGVLYCLRGAETNVASAMITINLIKEKMPPELFDLLLEKAYYHDEGKPPFAILEKAGEGYVFSREVAGTNNFFKFIAELATDNPDTIKARTWLNHNYLKITVTFDYEPGDMIIVNQRTTIRGIVINGLEESMVHDRWLVSSTARLSAEPLISVGMAEHMGIIIPKEIKQEMPSMPLDEVCALLRRANLISPVSSAEKHK